MDKKGLAGAALVMVGIGAFVLGLVVLGIYLGVGAKIVSDVQGTMTVNSVAYNASGSALTGIANVSTWTGTMGTVIGAVAILAIIGLIGYGGYQMAQGR